MCRIVAQPVSAEAFAPFGALIAPPETPGRRYLDETLASARPGAWASLSVARIAPLAGLPRAAVEMERHAFSSQSFLPLEASRYLVLVAPHAPGGGPDGPRAQAFIVDGRIGITYHADVWHHPMAVLDAPATFAILMWRDGGPGDEEFAALAAPIQVALPA